MRTAVALAAAAATVVGCNTGTTGLRPGVSSSCSVTFSGAFTGTYDCQPATTAYSLVDGDGVFSFGVTQSGSRPQVAVSLAWVGEPQVGSYANTDVGAVAHLAVTTSSGAAWLASVGENNVTATGTYLLTFSSVLNNLQTPQGSGYSTDGTLTATLNAVSGTGATGTVTLTATF